MAAIDVVADVPVPRIITLFRDGILGADFLNLNTSDHSFLET